MEGRSACLLLARGLCALETIVRTILRWFLEFQFHLPGPPANDLTIESRTKTRGAWAIGFSNLLSKKFLIFLRVQIPSVFPA
jgi:hypothetical protein